VSAPAASTAQDATRRGPATATGILAWIASGGPQHVDGSYAGWEDLRTGRLSPSYPEITGYVLGFLVAAGGGVDQEPARAAASWLAERVLGGDLRARPERTGTAVYTFDVAMAAHGLLRHGTDVGSDRAIEAGLACAGHLVDQVRARGKLTALDPATVTLPVTATWSTTGTVHLLKCVQALLTAHLTGHPQALAAAERLLEAEVRGWDGVFPPRTCPSRDTRSMHALCYAAEGLWVWGTFADDERALGLSRRLTLWLWERRAEDGGLPSFVTGKGADVRRWRQEDVTAQVLRLVQLHPGLGIDVTDGLHRLAADAWVRGPHAGMLYQPDSPDQHANCWASMFGYQALRLAEPGSTLSWSELV
jgi:hypothetical protein